MGISESSNYKKATTTNNQNFFTYLNTNNDPINNVFQNNTQSNRILNKLKNKGIKGIFLFFLLILAFQKEIFEKKIMESFSLNNELLNNKKIKIFVITRYFIVDDIYGEKMYTHDFLYSWFNIFKNNLIKTLNNLKNKNFELIICIHDKVNINDVLFFNSIKAKYKISIIYKGQIIKYLKSFYDKYDYIIQSRIDFDDYIFSDVINDLLQNISKNLSIKLYGYCSGYVYFLKTRKWYDFYNELHNIGHWGVFSSLIFSTKFIKNKTDIYIYSFNHGKSKDALQIWCQKNNIEWKNEMFAQNLTKKAFIYYRPFNSYSEMNLKKKNIEYILPKYCNRKISKPEKIKAEFGFPYK